MDKLFNHININDLFKFFLTHKEMAKNKKKKANNGPALSDERLIKERMRLLEKGRCFCSDTFEKSGEGIVIVSRRHTGGNVSFCAYLIDTYCLGLGSAFWSVRTADMELDNWVSRGGNMRECSYDEAHNWVYGAIAWAEDAGIEPCKEWRLAQYFLDEDTDDVPLMELPLGREGKHFLVANSKAELNRYLPILRENLGNDFDYVVRDEEYDDNDLDEEYTDDDDYDPFEEWDKDYSYIHPPLPTELNLHHPKVRNLLFAHDPLWYLSPEDAKRILSLPREELREDLEQMILHTLGLIYEGKATEKEDAIIENAALLLGEVGNDSTSLSALLEILKISNRLFEEACGDMVDKTIVASICKLGAGRLDMLYEFMHKQGFDSMHKCYVSEAVSEMFLQQADRRTGVIEWYRKLLLKEMEGDKKAMVGHEGMGFVVSDLVDIQAIELLEEIKKVFDKGLVSTGVCGDFNSIKRDILHPQHLRANADLDVYDRIEDLNEFVERSLNDL